MIERWLAWEEDVLQYSLMGWQSYSNRGGWLGTISIAIQWGYIMTGGIGAGRRALGSRADAWRASAGRWHAARVGAQQAG